MKAVLVLVVLALAATAGVRAHASDAADASSFNTHDADALDVDLDADARLEMETDTTTEAEVVDADAAAEEGSVEFEDELDAADAADDEAADAAEDLDAAADALDTDEADAALDRADADAEAEHKVEQKTFETLTKADLSAALGDRAAVAAKACAPDAQIKCPDNTVVFAKIARAPDYNGCGPAGAKFLNDKLLGGKFSPCCNNHDLCYGKPHATKEQCDTGFLLCMNDVCKNGFGCKTKAWVYYQAVAIGGCDAWKASRLRKGCLTGPEAASNPTHNTGSNATPEQTAAAAKHFPKL